MDTFDQNVVSDKMLQKIQSATPSIFGGKGRKKLEIFKGIGGLEKGLEAAWTRNSVILHNIANVDTPNFKSSHVEFEELYKAALDMSDGELSTDTVSELRTVVVEDDDTTYRMDGNNVDIDQQMTDMAKNVIWYNTLTSKVNGQFKQLRTAITGGNG